jgi:hypothetical protein
MKSWLIFIICLSLVFSGCDLLSDYNRGEEDETEDDSNNGLETETPELTAGTALPDGSLREKLNTISQRDDKNVYYDIVITSNIQCRPQTIQTNGENVVITLYSVTPGSTYALILNEPGSLFTVNANTTLVLKDLIIQGQPGNTAPLLTVNSGGTLKLLGGAAITGNINTITQGGGCLVNKDGVFIMEGGEIYSNQSTEYNNGHGGGVAVLEGGDFNMKGGKIYNNETENFGGGVYVYRGTFIMNGGEISANNAWYGGGVYADVYSLYVMHPWRPWSTGIFKKEPLPGTEKSGVIYGYPANGKENYAAGPTVYYRGNYAWYRFRTLGEYDAITTVDTDNGWDGREG